jgi:hypothetical protein
MRDCALVLDWLLPLLDNAVMELYDPFAKSSLWYIAWRHHVREMKSFPEQYGAYSRAAVIAQAQYVIWRAIESVKFEKSQ